MTTPKILALDRGGNPWGWITWEEAVTYHAKGLVAWQTGASDFEFKGGTSRMTGERSRISTQSIIAVQGMDLGKLGSKIFKEPTLENHLIFRRDRHLCAYCGNVYAEEKLTRDHILPIVMGGKDKWMNLVTACRGCNHRKAGRTPEGARMQLLYVPYVPNRYEYLILQNRKILADQMEFLMAGVPQNSRIREEA
jgi:hypothetical protein